jgi:hypothetical protein
MDLKVAKDFKVQLGIREVLVPLVRLAMQVLMVPQGQRV